MSDSTVQIAQHAKFDLSEFRERWSRARIGALRTVLSSIEGSDLGSCCGTCQAEEQLLLSVPEDLRDSALRKVFDNSRQLGLSIVKYLGMTWEVSDLTDVLPHMMIPCFAVSWRRHNDAHILEREGCATLATLGSFGCDYWREALDGLVMGVGENERLSRHQSKGHGDPGCLDVLFTEVYIAPRVISADEACASRSHKYGAMPDSMSQALEPLRRRFHEMKVRVAFEGLSENVLYYRLDAEEGVLCGAGGKLLHDSLTDEVARLYPKLRVQDAAPLAVYGGSS